MPRASSRRWPARRCNPASCCTDKQGPQGAILGDLGTISPHPSPLPEGEGAGGGGGGVRGHSHGRGRGSFGSPLSERRTRLSAPGTHTSSFFLWPNWPNMCTPSNLWGSPCASWSALSPQSVIEHSLPRGRLTRFVSLQIAGGGKRTTQGSVSSQRIPHHPRLGSDDDARIGDNVHFGGFPGEFRCTPEWPRVSHRRTPNQERAKL
jgi:hypothetical protein